MKCSRVGRTLDKKSRQIVNEQSVNASSGQRTSWRKGRTRASLRASWEEKAAVAAVSQQSHRSDKPLNRQTTPLVGVFSCVSLGGLSCKSVGCIHILDRKCDRLVTNIFSMSLLDVYRRLVSSVSRAPDCPRPDQYSGS